MEMLPDEMLLHILSFLKEIERYRLLPVNKRLKYLCLDKTLCKTKFDYNVRRAFLECCRDNHILCFDFIVEKVVSPEYSIPPLGTLIVLWIEGMKIACSNGYGSLLRKILKLDPKDDFLNCLYTATERNHLSVVRQLLKHHEYTTLVKEKAKNIYAKTEEMIALINSFIDVKKTYRRKK